MKESLFSEEVLIPLDGKHSLKGTLSLPKKASKIILFAHGSGSSRFSPRNQFVAKTLIQEGLATLLLDLLTEEEEITDDVTAQYRFDIPLLTQRLLLATGWISTFQTMQKCKVGYFGASTGSAAALSAAASKKNIFAIVSRGGRPDLATCNLSQIKAPVLLIVGGYDLEVLELNQKAFAQLGGEKKLEIVPKATHLFEEKGALEEVARLATLWFTQHF